MNDEFFEEEARKAFNAHFEAEVKEMMAEAERRSNIWKKYGGYRQSPGWLKLIGKRLIK